MAGKKISELISGSLSNLTLDSSAALVYSGTTFQHTLSDLRDVLVDSGSHTLNGDQTINGNLIVSGSITAQEYIISSSVTHIDIQTYSGSSNFGDDSNDIHKFIGNVDITGSVEVSEDIVVNSHIHIKDHLSVGPTLTHHTGSEYEAAHFATTNSINIAHFEGDTQYYAQINVRNIQSGSLVSSDIVATADNGNETNHFVNLGINSSTYNGGFVGRENDAYLLNVGKDLYIGTVGGSEHPSKLFLFGQNEWENPQITISGSGQVSFNTCSCDPGYTYQFSGSAKFQNDLEVVGSTTSSYFTGSFIGDASGLYNLPDIVGQGFTYNENLGTSEIGVTADVFDFGDNKTIDMQNSTIIFSGSTINGLELFDQDLNTTDVVEFLGVNTSTVTTDNVTINPGGLINLQGEDITGVGSLGATNITVENLTTTNYSTNLGFGSAVNTYDVNLGFNAGSETTGYAVAIGFEAGRHATDSYTVKIGQEAGKYGVGGYSVAIGSGAGVGNLVGTSNDAVVSGTTLDIGSGTGFAVGQYLNHLSFNGPMFAPGTYIVSGTAPLFTLSRNAIQNGTGEVSTYGPSAGGVILNGNGGELPGGSSPGFFVSPIRNIDNSNGGGKVLHFNTTTKEISYSTLDYAGIIGTTIQTNGLPINTKLNGDLLDSNSNPIWDSSELALTTTLKGNVVQTSQVEIAPGQYNTYTGAILQEDGYTKIEILSQELNPMTLNPMAPYTDQYLIGSAGIRLDSQRDGTSFNIGNNTPNGDLYLSAGSSGDNPDAGSVHIWGGTPGLGGEGGHVILNGYAGNVFIGPLQNTNEISIGGGQGYSGGVETKFYGPVDFNNQTISGLNFASGIYSNVLYPLSGSDTITIDSPNTNVDTLTANSLVVTGSVSGDGFDMFATTGSNSFTEDQQITGSVYIDISQDDESIYFSNLGDTNTFIGTRMGSMTIGDGAGYIQLDANNTFDNKYVSFTLNANNDESILSFSDITNDRVGASINLNSSGSFNISTFDNTAELLINGVLYDSHLVSTSSFNTFTSSVPTLSGLNEFTNDQSISGGGLYINDSLITTNGTELTFGAPDDGSVVMSIYNSNEDVVHEVRMGSDGVLSAPGGVEVSGSLNISGSATLNNDNIVSSNTIQKIETITSSSYASITPVSGTLYIIID